MNRLTALTILIAAALTFTACSFGTGSTDGALLGSDVDPAAPSDGPAQDGASAGVFGDLPVDPYLTSSTRAVVIGGDAGIDVHNTPGGSVVDTLTAATEYGTTRVLLVEETEGDWIRVRLPMRPNHRSGWVSASAVQLDEVEPSIVIDLEQRLLTVRSAEGVILQSTVAVGSEENPTPVGTFYITDKLETPQPDGAYGPFALGLSGYSETLTEFAGGNGQIGIHGTNDPGSIGEAVSHGCIRLPNDIIVGLADLLPLGTPVHIV